MLDRIDRTILTSLDRNARVPLSQLARNLRLGRDIVEYRLEKMRDTGILKKTMVVINPHQLGLMIFRCYLRLRSSMDERQKLFDWLKRRRSVFWVAETWGRFDAIFTALVRSPQEFDEIHTDLLERFPTLVLSHDVSLTVDVLSYPRRHLLTTQTAPKAFHWGGKLGNFELGDIDVKLVSFLSEDAQLSHTELAERCNSTPNIVRRKLEHLESAGVIIGYRTQVDLSKMGYRYVKQQLEFAAGTDGRGASLVRRLKEFCDSSPFVVYLIRQLGQYRVEIESEEPVSGDYGIVLQQLDSVLGSSLRSSEVLLISRDHHHRLRL